MDDLREVGQVPDADAGDHGADLSLIDIDDATDGKSPLVEAAVSGERLSEVAGADDDDRPVLCETELAADLVDEEFDVVADAARAVASEVAEVLAHFGGVDAGEFGQFVRRHVVGTVVELLGQDAQVHGQAGDGCLRDATT
jgi:hypothetical protein